MTKQITSTTLTIKIYVPDQYDATRPAALFVMLDDLLFELPTMVDNLIDRGDMPVTIGVAVTPGKAESEWPV